MRCLIFAHGLQNITPETCIWFVRVVLFAETAEKTINTQIATRHTHIKATLNTPKILGRITQGHIGIKLQIEIEMFILSQF